MAIRIHFVRQSTALGERNECDCILSDSNQSFCMESIESVDGALPTNTLAIQYAADTLIRQFPIVMLAIANHNGLLNISSI